MRRLTGAAAWVLAAGAAMADPAVAGPGAADRSEPPEIAFYAAASLRDALQDLAPRCESALRVRLVFNFGASNELARQIIAAGKADVFFSADEAWMDRIAEAKLADAASRRSLLSNRLVVVGPAGTTLRIAGPEGLSSPAVRRIALANPEAVPAGKYAKAWLENAGVWDAVRARVTPSMDVRSALALVESGAVDLGVIYRTDAAISPRIRVLFEVPESQGPRISYAIAAVAGRPALARARDVVAWLAGPEAAKTFERFGFIVIGPPA